MSSETPGESSNNPPPPRRSHIPSGLVSGDRRVHWAEDVHIPESRNQWMDLLISDIERSNVDWTRFRDTDADDTIPRCEICYFDYTFNSQPVIPNYTLPPLVSPYRAICWKLQLRHWCRGEGLGDLQTTFPALRWDAVHHPVLLECGHVFGLLCILDTTVNLLQGHAGFSCPKCRARLFGQFPHGEYFMREDAPMYPVHVHIHRAPEDRWKVTWVNLLHAPYHEAKVLLREHLDLSQRFEFWLTAYMLMQVTAFKPPPQLVRVVAELSDEIVPAVRGDRVALGRLEEVNEYIRRSGRSSEVLPPIVVHGYPPGRTQRAEPLRRVWNPLYPAAGMSGVQAAAATVEEEHDEDDEEE